MNIVALIDADNVDCSTIPEIIEKLSTYGHIIVKRAYGDWSTPNLKGWKDTLNELTITPVQQFSYTPGKNASDIALVIDAMDLLYKSNFDIFALVSSDSDFTKLASRLRESRIQVLGFGQKKAPAAFQKSCDSFTCIEPLKLPKVGTDEQKDNAPNKLNNTPKKNGVYDKKLVQILRDSIKECSNEDGWALVSTCGSFIKRQYPNIKYQSYGHKTLTKLLDAMECFNLIRSAQEKNTKEQVYVRNI